MYSLASAPLIVHACHCTYCQRESGTAFALNAIYEPSHVKLTGRTTSSGLIRKSIPTASDSDGQTMIRCPDCYTVVWSHYKAGGALVMVRVGTVDAIVDGENVLPSGGLEPHAHIFAKEGRHEWVKLEGQIVYPGYGPRDEYWPKESLARLEAFSKDGAVEAFKT